jgi:hypothetical protein
MITIQDIQEIREQIQNDLLCLMDELPSEQQDAACQIVVGKMKQLIDKVE